LKIISHRGYWEKADEKNSLSSFERSFRSGFGTETDIRDFCGTLVISHDIADESCITVRQFLDLYSSFLTRLPLALNIKADGLQFKLCELLKEYEITNYFVFDMSIPDTLGYIRSGLNFFSRQSEYEPTPAFYKEASGVWMDCFHDDWIQEADIEQHLTTGKQICLVSPELHKREYGYYWEYLSRMKSVASEQIMLCSDFPEEAREFFYGKN